MMLSKHRFITPLFVVSLLLTTSQSLASQLDKQGSPQITEQIIEIASSDQISKEIGIGKILSQASGGFNGYIRLEWFDDNFQQQLNR